MNKYFLFFIILFLPANAEIVTVTEKFSHTGDVSRIEACNIAEQRAITKAKRSVLKLSKTMWVNFFFIKK